MLTDVATVLIASLVAAGLLFAAFVAGMDRERFNDCMRVFDHPDMSDISLEKRETFCNEVPR